MNTNLGNYVGFWPVKNKLKWFSVITVVALVGCGKKGDGNTGVVNPNKPSPEAVSEKLITDPIVEKAIRSELSFNKPTGELTKADLEKVTKLDLKDTQITDTGLKDVAKLRNLTELFLKSTKITDACVRDLAKLQQLRILELSNTKITNKGATVLIVALVKCEITHSYKKD